MTSKRCTWCDENSKIYTEYHDKQWAVPVYDDTELFEMLILEGMQAGLSWITILNKRENFRAACDNFNYLKIAAYKEDKIAELLNNSGIIRNRLKIHAMVKNAKVFIQIQQEFDTFRDYIWSYVNFTPIQNHFNNLVELPAQTELSTRISKDLKKHGMNFVGPTIIYSFMQAIGMVNDHETSCFRYSEVQNELKNRYKNKSHIDIQSYVNQTIAVITDSDAQQKTLELYATRLLNELMSRRLDINQAKKMVDEYQLLIKEQLQL